MEKEPELDNENIHYLDEYPELKKRVWLRRMAQERLVAQVVVGMTNIIIFERPEPPDGAA